MGLGGHLQAVATPQSIALTGVGGGCYVQPVRSAWGVWGSTFLAEQQRRGALGGLAIASALIVLVASGAALNRLGSDRSGGGPSDTAGSALESGSTTSGPTAVGNGSGPTPVDTSGALSSASAPV